VSLSWPSGRCTTHCSNSCQVETPVGFLSDEPQSLVIGGHHARGGENGPETPVPEQPRPAIDELPGGEVAVSRCHVIQLDLRHSVAGVADDDGADRLVTRGDEVCVALVP